VPTAHARERDAKRLARLAGEDEFPRLVAALVRVALADDYDAVPKAARWLPARPVDRGLVDEPERQAGQHGGEREDDEEDEGHGLKDAAAARAFPRWVVSLCA